MKPLKDWIKKVNCAGAWLTKSGVGGVGCVSRDADGLVLVITSKFINDASSAFMVECLAIRDGCLLASKLNASKVVFEMDCSQAY